MQGIQPKLEHERRLFRIIDQTGLDIGEMETIYFLPLADSQHFHHVAVGNETCLGIGGQPKIIVADHHQQFPGDQVAVHAENPAPELVVEQIGPFVGTCDENHLFPLPLPVFGLQHILQSLPFQTFQIRLSMRISEREQGQSRILPGNLSPQSRRILQNQRTFPLPDHFFQSVRQEMQRETRREIVQIQGRAVRRTDRGQLGRVTDQQDPATVTRPHVPEKIIQEGIFLTDHRSLVHNIERVPRTVLPQGKLYTSLLVRFRIVNLLMYRAGRRTRIMGQDLGCPPGRSQKHRRDVQNGQGPDQGGDHRSLTCPGIALQNKTHVRTELEDEGSQFLHQFRLAMGRYKRQIGRNQTSYAFFCKFSCHFQALKVISSKPRCAFQPKSRLALSVLAQICSISPSLRPTIL